MRKTSLIVWVTGIWLAATPAAQAGTVFDGQWTVNIVCPAYQDAEAYTEHFSVVIQNGQLLGQRGTAGQPGYLTLGGTVADDGTIKLSGTQLTNNPDYSVGHVPAGTKIPFTVNGRWMGIRGRGRGRRFGRARIISIGRRFRGLVRLGLRCGDRSGIRVEGRRGCRHAPA